MTESLQNNAFTPEGTYSVFLPNYTIGMDDAYDHIDAVCTASGTTAVLIGGKRALTAAEPVIRAAAHRIRVTDALLYGTDCTEETITALCETASVRTADMLFAIGGGKATDTTKAVGERLGKPVYAFPTIASNCSSCTSVSILYHTDGSFSHPYFLTKPPLHTFIDLRIIAQAPPRYFWAGMGDTYAKYFESTLSSRGEQLPHYEALGVVISQMCLDPILRFGETAYHDHERGIASPAFREVVLAIIVTTALTSILVTKDRIIDYNTGLAHAINYALTSYPQVEHEHLHGEIVSYGVLILLLSDRNEMQFDALFRFSRALKLPTHLSDLGLSKEQIPDIITGALAMKDIAHNPYPITKEMLLEAFERLEGMP